VSFSESIIIMTTNIGQPHFLDARLSVEEASAEAIREIEKTYRTAQPRILQGKSLSGLFTIYALLAKPTAPFAIASRTIDCICAISASVAARFDASSPMT